MLDIASHLPFLSSIDATCKLSLPPVPCCWLQGPKGGPGSFLKRWKLTSLHSPQQFPFHSWEKSCCSTVIPDDRWLHSRSWTPGCAEVSMKKQVHPENYSSCSGYWTWWRTEPNGVFPSCWGYKHVLVTPPHPVKSWPQPPSFFPVHIVSQYPDGQDRETDFLQVTSKTPFKYHPSTLSTAADWSFSHPILDGRGVCRIF